jgi:CRISPR-associated protein Cmr4
VSYKGVVRIYDAEIVLFPVPTKHGPAWVTTPELLYKHFDFQKPQELNNCDKVVTTIEFKNGLNLGPLMFPETDVTKKSFSEISTPDQAAADDYKWNPSLTWKTPLTDIQNLLAIVHSSIFSQLVNRNLEVRTSVSIDPKTGAATEGLLFTSEAIPAMTFFALPLVLQEFADEHRKKSLGETPLQVVESGLNLLALFGVGGMATRGFGRLKVFV